MINYPEMKDPGQYIRAPDIKGSKEIFEIGK